MLRYWGRPYYNRRNEPTAVNETVTLDIPFPYNHTEYIKSGKQAEYESIWMKALNLSSHSDQNKSHTANEFMMKSRMLADMVDAPVHPHSFATVMAIASLFLFFTLGVTVTLVIFCRKKNVVFALQKSEQEDEIDYEMDDIEMDTNTDVEYGSDGDSDHREHRYSFTFPTNTDSPSRRPLMSIYANPDANLTATSPIYRPKRPSQAMDSKGVYQPVQMTAAIEAGDDYDTASDGSVTESPLPQRHPRFLSYSLASFNSKKTTALFLAKCAIVPSAESKASVTKVSHCKERINIEAPDKESVVINGLKCDKFTKSPMGDLSHGDNGSVAEMNTATTTSSNARSVYCNSGSATNALTHSQVGPHLNDCINTKIYDNAQNMRYLAHEEAIVHGLSKLDSRNKPTAKCSCKALLHQNPEKADSHKLLSTQSSVQRDTLHNPSVNTASSYKYNSNNPFLKDIFHNHDPARFSVLSYSRQDAGARTKASLDGKRRVQSDTHRFPSTPETTTALEGARQEDTRSYGSNTAMQSREHWVTFEQT